MNFVDQLDRTVALPNEPKRIISLVPSQTELLHHLGLEEEVIGITKFCVHPEKWFRNKPRVGGTKTVNIEKIKSLHPDLIIANKEENVQEQVEALAKEFPVWVSDVNTLDDAYEMIKGIGEITAKKQETETLVEQIQKSFAGLKLPTAIPIAIRTKLQTCYLIWKDPYMTAGGDTFIHDMLTNAGFENAFAQTKRYPVVTIEDLPIANCQLIFLSSEPYPFKQNHVDELQTKLPHTKIILVNGEMFSWYGSRLLQVPAYFKSLHQQIAAMV